MAAGAGRGSSGAGTTSGRRQGAAAGGGSQRGVAGDWVRTWGRRGASSPRPARRNAGCSRSRHLADGRAAGRRGRGGGRGGRGGEARAVRQRAGRGGGGRAAAAAAAAAPAGAQAAQVVPVLHGQEDPLRQEAALRPVLPPRAHLRVQPPQAPRLGGACVASVHRGPSVFFFNFDFACTGMGEPVG